MSNIKKTGIALDEIPFYIELSEENFNKFKELHLKGLDKQI